MPPITDALRYKPWVIRISLGTIIESYLFRVSVGVTLLRAACRFTFISQLSHSFFQTDSYSAGTHPPRFLHIHSPPALEKYNAEFSGLLSEAKLHKSDGMTGYIFFSPKHFIAVITYVSQMNMINQI